MYSKKSFKNSVVMITKVHDNRAERSKSCKDRIREDGRRYDKIMKEIVVMLMDQKRILRRLKGF